MSHFAPMYIGWRIWHRFIEFFRHWYLRSFVLYSYEVLEFFERIDRIFAFRITLRHFGEPLYQDRTVVGYIMGFVFRSARLFIAGVFYLFALLVAAILYVIWCLVPLVLIYKVLFSGIF